MFVGANRQAEVERLTRRLQDVYAKREPALVVYVSPPGWGKTRIIQEFYRAIAARQSSPRYWPSSLVRPGADGAAGVLRLGHERKVVGHRDIQVPSDALMPWLWLAPSTGRLGDGSPVPVLDTLAKQISRHVPHLVSQMERRQTLSRDAIEMIVSALPMPDLMELACTVTDVSDVLIELLQSGRSHAGTRAVTDADGVGRVHALSRMLVTLISGGGASAELVPVILVLDDAQDVDAAAASFVTDLLSSELPVLIIATCWPDRLSPTSSDEPFAQLIAATMPSGRVTRVDPNELSADDLVTYIRDAFPATDPHVAARLAQRADHNPYALRLLLNLPRVVDSIREGAIILPAGNIDHIRGGLADLLSEHWTRLPLSVQQVLVVASLLGQSVHDDVLRAGLARLPVSVGLDDAYASAWIRPATGGSQITEFVEHLRYEIALDRVPAVLHDDIRGEILASALHSVHAHLTREQDRGARRVLLTLHVQLARASIETDLAAVARSARELAELALEEHRRIDAIAYLTEAVEWLDRMPQQPWSELIDCLTELSYVKRIAYGDLTGEPDAVRALVLADTHLDESDEVRVKARLRLARCRRIRSDHDRYESARRLLDEAGELFDRIPEPTISLVRLYRSVRAGFIGIEGDRSTATQLFLELVAYCEQRYGPSHRLTIGNVEDAAFQAVRSWDGQAAIQLRRLALERRIEASGTAGSLQTANARNDLAHALLVFGGSDALPEAEHLLADAQTIWARAYGLDGKSTRRVRLLRVLARCLRGLVHEDAGQPDEAKELFQQAADEAQRICDLRRDGTVLERALALQRLGLPLACLRDPRAIRVLDEPLRAHEVDLRRAVDSWGVRTQAHVLGWAYERLGRQAEAAALRRRYDLPEGWRPGCPYAQPSGRPSSGGTPELAATDG
jgi:tetratricopeptide (TPR) repeat protein